LFNTIYNYEKKIKKCIKMMIWENMDYFQKLMCMKALKKVNEKVNFVKYYCI